jgi:hypothetical protein
MILLVQAFQCSSKTDIPMKAKLRSGEPFVVARPLKGSIDHKKFDRSI